MYAAAAKEIRDGKMFGELKTYGYDAPGGGGADLMYSKDAAFNPAVPAPIVSEINSVKAKLAKKELKLTVTKEDARGGI
jgi:basic membrane protein A and related proteins